jgi:hypothetical protein
MINEYEIIIRETIEPSTIVLSVVIGFGLTLLIGFISWGVSLIVRTFWHIVRGS